MNLLDKICFGLLIFTALISSSCEDPSDIGQGLGTNGLGVDINYIEIPLTATNIFVDSIVTSQAGRFFVGKEKHPLFGETSATGYGSLSFISSLYIPDDSVYTDNDVEGQDIYVYDGAFLTIEIDKFHVDSLAVGLQTIKVHSLEDSIFSSVDYHAHHSTAYDLSTVLAEFELSLDSVKADTSAYDEILKIPLSDDLGKSLFEIQSSENGDISNELNKIINGLAFVSGENNTALLGILPSTQTGIEINYHINDYSLDDDENTISLLYKDTTLFIGLENQYYTGFSNDASGEITSISNEPYNSFSAGDNAYILPALGLYPKVSLEPLSDFLALEENQYIQINVFKIELDIEDNSASSRFYANNEELRFYYIGEDGAKINPFGISSNAILNDTNSAIISTTNLTDDDEVVIDEITGVKEITLGCTPTLFGVLAESGLVNLDHLLIVPSNTASPDFSIFKKDGGMKLKIYYTTPN